MKRIETIQSIVENKLVAVVRATSKEEAIEIVDAIVKGGIRGIEVTMTVPGALDIIQRLVNRYRGSEIIIGAGTVLDAETARLCILAGAQFVVSPRLDRETVRLCNRYRIPVMPGVMTITEAVEALELGVEIVKLFPASSFNPSIIKDFKGPLPQINVMPTGGIHLENIGKWIDAGAIAVGIGGVLTEGAKTQNYEQITKTAEAFVLKTQR